MPNRNRPCRGATPGPNRNLSRIQQQTACAGRNRVTIQFLGAHRVRAHVFYGPAALADAALFLFRTFRAPATRRSNARLRRPPARRR